MPVAHRRRRSTQAADVAVLESKLAPPPGNNGAVPRPALLERLRWRHRTHPVALVSAGAGYGKTTLAAELAASDSRPTGWYTLDELDNDPVIFLTYLASVLERCGAPADGLTRAAAPDVTARSAAAAVKKAASAMPGPSLVVLDNVHLLEHPVCLQCIDALAAELLPGSQLVIVTRWNPPIAFDEVRTVRLGADDLRLTPQEAKLLLQTAAHFADTEEARTLERRSEGWAAGLYLLARSGRRSAVGFAGDRDAVERFVDDYFHAEVLDGLEPDTYAFLREVALLDRVSGALADSAIGSRRSADHLAELERLNLFVSRLDDEGEWYALHPLLRHLLRSEMRRAEPIRSETILERAADWSEQLGDLEAATECAVTSTNRERAAGLVAAAAPSAYWDGREADVERWLAHVDSPDILAAHRQLAVVGAGLLALLGQPEPAGRWASLAGDGSSRRRMADGSPETAWTKALAAFLCPDGVGQMLHDARAACELLAEQSPLRICGLLCLGFAELLTGDAAAAESSFATAAELAADADVPAGASVALAMLSLRAADRGDGPAAAALARSAAAFVRSGRLELHLSTSIVHAAAARAALSQRRISNAQSALQLADRLASRLTYALPWFASYVRLELANTHLAVGDAGRARELLAAAEEILARRPGLGIVEDWIATLRLDLRLGRSVADGATTALTAAELRLLPLLPSYLSFREIADRLDISRNTVKTQAISVYRKLGVTSRTDAVERAQTLGLLDRESPRPDDDLSHA